MKVHFSGHSKSERTWDGARHTVSSYGSLLPFFLKHVTQSVSFIFGKPNSLPSLLVLPLTHPHSFSFFPPGFYAACLPSSLAACLCLCTSNEPVRDAPESYFGTACNSTPLYSSIAIGRGSLTLLRSGGKTSYPVGLLAVNMKCPALT